MGDEKNEGSRAGVWSWLGMIARVPEGADWALDRAQAHLFRFLWVFLPAPSIARDLRFQHLLVSRFLSDAGQKSLVFGALVAVAREGGSALEVALVGVAALLPTAALGLYGGAIADALPRRAALAGAYGGQAALCFIVPPIFGTDLGVVLFLIFAVNVLGQVSQPTESSVLPLVASEEQLASAASLINLAAAAGGGLAMAVLAPVVVRAFGIELVFYIAGGMLVLAASRVFDLPVWDKSRRIRLARPEARVRPALMWVVQHPAVASMIIVAVLATTVNLVLMTLAPRYVEAVLDTDAADTAYVLAPSAIGVAVALIFAPSIMRFRGERVAALIGLTLATGFLCSMGIVGGLAPIIDPVNPMRLLTFVGLDLNEKVRAAGALALPLAFGVSLTATSVQTYINRRVPLSLQGRTFASQSALASGLAVVPLLVLATAAGQFGADRVLLVAPLMVLVLGYGLVRASFHFASREAPSYLEVASSFWEEPELE